MKTRLTYKEYSLIIGILVAVIVAFTFWMGNGPKLTQSQGFLLIPSFTSKFPATVILKKVRTTKALTSEAFSLELPSDQNNLY
jgi:hypothetical protein